MKTVLIIKLPKVGSNAIVPVPVGTGPNKRGLSACLKLRSALH